MKLYRYFVMLAAMALSSLAQSAFPTTTITVPLSAKGSSMLSVASTSGIHSYWMGQTILVVDGEAMCVDLVIPGAGYVFVRRGCQGSGTQNHAAGATVYFGPPQNYYFLPPGSPGSSCTASNYPFMPYIVINSGGAVAKWNCTGGIWVVS